MSAKRGTKRSNQVSARQERLRSLREHFQRERPSLDELVARGEYAKPLTQAAYLKKLAALARQKKRAKQ